MRTTVQIWESFYYGLTGEQALKQGQNVINTFKIGDKIVGGQIFDSKTLNNGFHKRTIYTVFPNGHLGEESRTYNSSNSELLHAYAKIHTSYGDIPTISGTKEFVNNIENIKLAAKNMYAKEGYKNALNLDTYKTTLNTSA